MTSANRQVSSNADVIDLTSISGDDSDEEISKENKPVPRYCQPDLAEFMRGYLLNLRPCRTGDGDSAPISLDSLEEDTAPLTEKSTTSVTSIPESDEEEESKRESLLEVKSQVSSRTKTGSCHTSACAGMNYCFLMCVCKIFNMCIILR